MGAVFLLAGNYGRNHAGSYGCDRLVYRREIASDLWCEKILVKDFPHLISYPSHEPLCEVKGSSS